MADFFRFLSQRDVFKILNESHFWLEVYYMLGIIEHLWK